MTRRYLFAYALCASALYGCSSLTPASTVSVETSVSTGCAQLAPVLTVGGDILSALDPNTGSAVTVAQQWAGSLCSGAGRLSAAGQAQLKADPSTEKFIETQAATALVALASAIPAK